VGRGRGGRAGRSQRRRSLVKEEPSHRRHHLSASGLSSEGPTSCRVMVTCPACEDQRRHDRLAPVYAG
jgi:hypothetical protein